MWGATLRVSVGSSPLTGSSYRHRPQCHRPVMRVGVLGRYLRVPLPGRLDLEMEGVSWDRKQ